MTLRSGTISIPSSSARSSAVSSVELVDRLRGEVPDPLQPGMLLDQDADLGREPDRGQPAEDGS